MNARELRTCLTVVMFALLATVNIQLFAVLYVSTDTNGKSPCFTLITKTTSLLIMEVGLAQWLHVGYTTAFCCLSVNGSVVITCLQASF